MPTLPEARDERRSFLSRFHLGAATIAALALRGRAGAQTATPPGRFEPARHDKDDWMDQIPGKHRLVFDTVSNEAMGEALLFASNFFTANRTDYGLKDSDLAVIILARHRSTALGFNDAMWEKYGVHMAPMTGLTSPPKTNPHLGGGLGIIALAGQGVHFAVCSMATGRVAGAIAKATGAASEAITAELVANLVPGARMVPAGIVAVSRAQERGYTLVTA